MKKMTLAIVVGTALSLNIAVSGVPVADGATISNGIKQLMEKIQEHKEQTQTWEEEEKRYETENKGLNSEQALKDMKVDEKNIEKLFEQDPFKTVYGNKKPEDVVKNIANKGIEGFPEKISTAAKKKYKGFDITASNAKSRQELALRDIALNCSARDAATDMLQQFDQAAQSINADKLKATKDVTGNKVQEKSSAEDNSGTASMAAGVGATVSVSQTQIASINSLIGEKRKELDKIQSDYQSRCSKAMDGSSRVNAQTGFSTVINALQILPESLSGDSFTPKTSSGSPRQAEKDPRFY